MYKISKVYTSGCNDISIVKFELVVKTPFFLSNFKHFLQNISLNYAKC